MRNTVKLTKMAVTSSSVVLLLSVWCMCQVGFYNLLDSGTKNRGPIHLHDKLHKNKNINFTLSLNFQNFDEDYLFWYFSDAMKMLNE